jgi:OmpA-OmpF porin, OOP family
LLSVLSTSATALSPGQIIVPFAFDSTAIDAEGRRVIEFVLLEFVNRRGGHIAVTGYADRAGPEDYNIALSRHRAQTVRDALVAGGISADRITIAGRGEAEPRSPTADGVPKAENRFVLIILQ